MSLCAVTRRASRRSQRPPQMLIAAALGLVAAGAAEATTLSYNPADPGYVECSADSLVVTVDVDAVTDLRGFTINLTYDPAKLHVMSVTAGSAITIDDGTHPIFFRWYDWSGGSDGTLRVDASLLGWSLTGSGGLVKLVFGAGGAKGTSALGFGTVTLRDHLNQVIPASVAPGSLVNRCNAVPVADDATFGLAENSVAGTVVGTVTATDGDSGDVLSYAITGGNGSGAFLIGVTSGQITVADSAPLDYETMAAFTLTVTVTDDDLFGPDSDTATITVNLSNVNEPPVVSGIPDQGVAEGETFATIALDDYVADPDHADDQLAWTATGQSALTVTITARVATVSAPGADWNGSEVITFTAADPNLLTGFDAATFTVTGVNDPPDVTTPLAQTNTVLDLVASLAVAATDRDNDTLTWSATNLPSGLTIAPDTGVISGTIACGADASSPYTVQVRVMDDGVGHLFTDVTFTWTVNPLLAPTALTALTATQVLAGNDSNGTTKIAVSWPDVPAGHVVKVYRKGFGAYPEYDDDGGTVPTPPVSQADLAGWEPAMLDGGTDEPVARDFWYYVAFVENLCGQSSGPSPMTGGTLNYHLGDVSDGVTPGVGDNQVASSDISALGASYATTPSDVEHYMAWLDVGPTTDFASSSRPTTDNVIEFEDLIIFAINYGVVGKGGSPEPADHNLLTVLLPSDPVEDRLEIGLWLAGDGSLRGASIPLTWDERVVRPIAVAAGELAGRQAGPTLVLAPRPGTVDVGLFGSRDDGLSGEGCLATVTFEVLAAGDPRFGVGEIRARDARNQPCDVSVELSHGEPPPSSEVPATSGLHAAYPNPFNPSTTVKYDVAVHGHVSLQIFDLSGRLVTTIVDETLPAGTYAVVWDGKDVTGRVVASGTYVARLQTSDVTQVRRMTLVK